jgi:hypothetical protein
MRFPFDEAEFIAWAESLGWTRDAIRANHHGTSLVIYDKPADGASGLLEIEKGYDLVSYGPRENSTHGISEEFPVRRIAYDEQSHTVYLQLWTPLPTTLKNGRDP